MAGAPGEKPEGPRSGDVLISKISATVEHEVCIVPAQPSVVCRNYDTAVSQADQLAIEHHVDAWLTEDHIHFVKIASHRTDRPHQAMR